MRSFRSACFAAAAMVTAVMIPGLRVGAPAQEKPVAQIPLKNRMRIPIPHTEFRAADGSAMQRIEAGHGRALLLVHGTLSDYRTWNASMDTLQNGARAIAYSLRCHWPNDCSHAKPYSTQGHVDDLAAVVRGLGSERVDLAGYSSGGAIAAHFALQHPGMVRRLILIEPGIFSVLPASDEVRLLMAQIGEAGNRARQALAREQDEEAIRQLMDWVFRPTGYAGLSPETRQMLKDNAPSLRAAVVSGAPPPPFACADAKKLTMPVLLLEGEKTAPEFRIVNDELARCLPTAKRAVVRGADHGLVLKQPREAAEAMLDFLRSTGH